MTCGSNLLAIQWPFSAEKEVRDVDEDLPKRTVRANETVTDKADEWRSKEIEAFNYMALVWLKWALGVEEAASAFEEALSPDVRNAVIAQDWKGHVAKELGIGRDQIQLIYQILMESLSAKDAMGFLARGLGIGD